MPSEGEAVDLDFVDVHDDPANLLQENAQASGKKRSRPPARISADQEASTSASEHDNALENSAASEDATSERVIHPYFKTLKHSRAILSRDWIRTDKHAAKILQLQGKLLCLLCGGKEIKAGENPGSNIASHSSSSPSPSGSILRSSQSLASSRPTAPGPWTTQSTSLAAPAAAPPSTSSRSMTHT